MRRGRGCQGVSRPFDGCRGSTAMQVDTSTRGSVSWWKTTTTTTTTNVCKCGLRQGDETRGRCKLAPPTTYLCNVAMMSGGSDEAAAADIHASTSPAGGYSINCSTCSIAWSALLSSSLPPSTGVPSPRTAAPWPRGVCGEARRGWPWGGGGGGENPGVWGVVGGKCGPAALDQPPGLLPMADGGGLEGDSIGTRATKGCRGVLAILGGYDWGGASPRYHDQSPHHPFLRAVQPHHVTRVQKATLGGRGPARVTNAADKPE